MRRREFLAQGTQAALALSLTPLAACAAQHTRPALSESPDTASLGRLTAHLGDQVPGWMRAGKDRDFIYHGGDNEGFHCAAVASVAGRSGFVAMTNGEGGTSVLRNLIVDEPMQEFLAS